MHILRIKEENEYKTVFLTYKALYQNKALLLLCEL
jgi:hypothetical protein